MWSLLELSPSKWTSSLLQGLRLPHYDHHHHCNRQFHNVPRARRRQTEVTKTGPLPPGLVPHYPHKSSSSLFACIAPRQSEGTKTGPLPTGLIPFYPHHCPRRRRRHHSFPIPCTATKIRFIGSLYKCRFKNLSIW